MREHGNYTTAHNTWNSIVEFNGRKMDFNFVGDPTGCFDCFKALMARRPELGVRLVQVSGSPVLSLAPAHTPYPSAWCSPRGNHRASIVNHA